MRFTDRINIDLPDNFAETQYFVAPDAEFLDDHFPQMPMLPGLVMLEIAVRTAAAWMTENLGEREKANFDLDLLERLYVTRRVVPNETLVVRVSIAEIAPDGKSGFFNAQAQVGDESAMRAKFQMRSLK